MCWTSSVGTGRRRADESTASAGRLTNEAQWVASPGKNIAYQYHADGRRQRLTYPDATWVTYEYSDNGWLTAIKDGGTNTIVSYVTT